MKINKSHFKYILNIISLILIAYSATVESTSILMIGMLILVVLILLGDSIEDFYILLSLVPFTIYLTNISNLTQYIFLGILVFSIVKLLFQNPKYKLNIFVIISAVYIIFIEIFNDLIIGRYIHSLSVVIFLTYFCVFILKINLIKYNYKYALRNLISGLMIAILTISFGFNRTLGDLLYIDNAIRLGEESGVTRLLGGAMSIPIYSLLVISLLISYLLLNKTTNTIKLIVIPCIAFSFIIGFLTVSRLYILGLAVVTLLITFSVFTTKGLKTFTFILTGFLLLIIYIFYNPIILENILMKFGQRTTNGFLNDIRTKIYLSILEYLAKNPEFLILGKGAIGYVSVGKEEGHLFGMMAHNLYLDGLISFGIFGIIFLTFIIVFFIKKCKTYFTGSSNLLTVMPIITLLAMYMTQGTFNYFDVYIYILFLILNVFSGEKNPSVNKHN